MRHISNSPNSTGSRRAGAKRADGRKGYHKRLVARRLRREGARIARAADVTPHRKRWR